MAKDPAFLFYPNDWVGGTMGMTFEQKGAYFEILMLQFTRGHMTEDMIVHVIGHMLWGGIKIKFKQDDKGLWFNERLQLEKIKRSTYVTSRTNNKLGKNQYSKEGHMTYHMGNGNKDIYGVKFFQNLEMVELSDGTNQKLGKSQKIRAVNDDIKPEEILKGKIY